MKIKIEGGIYMSNDKYSKGKYKFFCGKCESWQDYIAIMTHTIEVEAPEGFDPRAAEVDSLRAKRKEIHDAFASAVMEIDQRINSLLAIEMAP